MLGKVTFLLLIVPSRDAITKYRELKDRIEAAVGRINGRIGRVDWQPVIYQYRSVDHKKLCALYGAADVALIAPLRDGMNLVAKE
ncbi:MAG: trehalose-6-phosphate synthase [Flavobacteriales bacterium]|nr:trehalose-6-phosphate synthase [Flavobacteriales bacterium]